jgi:hypothetical protein
MVNHQVVKSRTKRRSGSSGDSQIATLRQEVCDELPNGDKWLITPHALFGGKAPEQMLTSGEHEAVRNLFESVLYIGIS